MMNCHYLLCGLLYLCVITLSQDEKNCDYNDYNDCYECDTDSQCIQCPNSLEYADCSTCTCNYSTSAYIISIMFWILICICCGFCCRYICCKQESQQRRSNYNKDPLIPNINKAGTTTTATFVKCTKCGKYGTVSSRSTTHRCTTCNTLLVAPVQQPKSNDIEEGEGKGATVKCVKCNTNYPMGCKFCSQCGETLVNERAAGGPLSAQTDNESMGNSSRCRLCGKFNSSGSNLCVRCAK